MDGPRGPGGKQDLIMVAYAHSLLHRDDRHMDTHNKRHDSDVVMGSERSFGLVFAFVFAVIGLWPLWKTGQVRIWAFVISAIFLGLALVIPAVLKPLNTIWFKFGLLLGRVMTPIVMSLVYGLTVVPIGLLLRALGKDLLRLEPQPDAPSYWIKRDENGPAKGSMKNQF